MEALRDIVAVSQARNAKLGISGAHYYDGAYFMQALGGDRKAVEAVFESITHDSQHSDIRLVKRGDTAGARVFRVEHGAGR